MKINKTIKIFYIFILTIILSSCSCKRINTLQDVEDSMDIGRELVKNLEKYKNKYGKYPKSLNDLVPEFYSEVPKTKMKEWFFDNYKINYDKYIYRDFLYYVNSGIVFNAELNPRPCYSIANDTCPRMMHYEYEDIRKFIKLYKYEGLYEGWQYFSYNKCQDYNNTLKCIFKKQLKCEYQEVQVENE